MVWRGGNTYLKLMALDDFRRDVNVRGAERDGTAWLLLAACLPLVLALKAGHDTGLLLLGRCNTVVALGLWLLQRYRRGAYVARRELCCLLGYAPVVLFAAVQQSVTGHLHLHGGRALRLLALLLVAHPGSWCLIGALYGGAVVAANQLVLPSVALMSVLLGNHSTCRQLLQVPGVEQPLRRLHRAASWAHTGVVLPPVFAGVGQPPQPMQQCLAVNAWLTAVLGAVLPLFLLSRMEAAARRRFYARRWQEGAGEAGDMQLEVRPMGWSTLYCCSFLCWQVCDVAYTVSWRSVS